MCIRDRDMGKAIAAAYGVKHIEVLTGFKYIGEQMLKFEKTGCNNYVFGMEAVSYTHLDVYKRQV